jgi:hypothetical protein
VYVVVVVVVAVVVVYFVIDSVRKLLDTSSYVIITYITDLEGKKVKVKLSLCFN